MVSLNSSVIFIASLMSNMRTLKTKLYGIFGQDFTVVSGANHKLKICKIKNFLNCVILIQSSWKWYNQLQIINPVKS